MTRLTQFSLSAALMAIAGLVAIGYGQDVNWDLQNYHYYIPWAWAHDRTFGPDIAPAQLQTYFNPLLDLPFYAMVRADWDPRLVTFAIALPAGIGAFVLLKILLLLFADLPVAARRMAVGTAFVIGVTGAAGRAMLGSTMNEWPGAMATMVALWLLLRALATDAARPIPATALGASGLLVGLASGLKLTVAAYAVGLCAAILLRQPWREPRIVLRLRETAAFGVAALIGLAASYGTWGYGLWRRFANPFFPHWDGFFRSPWWAPPNVAQNTFGLKSSWDWLRLPYLLTGDQPMVFAEVKFLDLRLPILMALAAAALLAWGWRRAGRRRRAAPIAGEAPAPRAATGALFAFAGIFWLASFVAWYAKFGVYRYLIPCELLAGAFMVALLLRLAPARHALAAALVVAVALLATTRPPDWGHIAYGPRWFITKAPPLAPGALVVITTYEPVGWVIPFFQEDARFVGAGNNIVSPRRKSKLSDAAAAEIAGHAGPLYALTYPADFGRKILDAHRLAPVPGTCREISANMPASPLQLCELRRTDGAAAVP